MIGNQPELTWEEKFCQVVNVGDRFPLTDRIGVEVTTLNLDGKTIKRVATRFVLDGQPMDTLPLEDFLSLVGLGKEHTHADSQ